MALSYYHAVRIAFIVLMVMQVVRIADAQTSKWTDTCYKNPCTEGSGKNYDCPNVPDFFDKLNTVCDTNINLWTLDKADSPDGKGDTVPFSFLTWKEHDTMAGIDWTDCSKSDALKDTETLFVIVHGAAEDPDRYLGKVQWKMSHICHTQSLSHIV